MGGSSSSLKQAESKFTNFYDIVDNIATYYILTMDFTSMRKLSEKEYCNKLVVLTSDIIDRYFNDKEVVYLAQRVKDGKEINEMRTEKVRFLNKDNLDNLDISNDVQKTIKKKRICIGIAKYYVKIAHIFAAIVMTINPVYTYKDTNGETVKKTLMEKDTIPKNVDRKLQKLNMCDNRIRSLKNGEVYHEDTNKVSIQPKVCSVNVNKDGNIKSLADEPGIPELMTLYLDDKYDYSTGTFTGMSDTTQSQFRKDLQRFYTAFTGNKEMPPTIQKFSDISLRDYSKNPMCGKNVSFEIDKKDDLFVQYAENINQMIQRAATNQMKLLDVINMLFTFVKDPFTGKNVIMINPKLTETSLQTAVEHARKFIIDLYINCEMDYLKGVNIFEAIVEKTILHSTEQQIKMLEKKASQMIQQTKQMTAPDVNKEINVNIKQPPINQPPINQPPINQPPNNQPLNNQPPINEPLINQQPINQPPINEPLINQPPINQPLNNQPLNNQPPNNQPPNNQPPINQPPINQPPNNQPPINQPPNNQPPINQPPINQPPINQPPVNREIEPIIQAPANQV